MKAPMKRLVAVLQSEAGSALPLLAAAVLALLLANSPLAWMADQVLGTKFTVAFGTLGLSKPLMLWINDGLMAVFFLLVGSRSSARWWKANSPARAGRLADRRRAGGILVPAAIYAAFTWKDPVALNGWAIPSATDIAFAVAILAALGKRVPAGLKLFLLTLAIVDDLAAIVIIAIFYTADLSTLSLVLAGLCILVLLALNFSGVRRNGPYCWSAWRSGMRAESPGVHATLAGVVLAFCLPLAYRTTAPTSVRTSGSSTGCSPGCRSSCCRCSPSPIRA